MGFAAQRVVGEFVGVHHAQWVSAVLAVDGYAKHPVVGQQVRGIFGQDVRRVLQWRDTVHSDTAPDHLGEIHAGALDAGLKHGCHLGVDHRQRVHLPPTVIRRRRVLLLPRSGKLSPQPPVEVEILAGKLGKRVQSAPGDVQVEKLQSLQDDVGLRLVVVEDGVLQARQRLAAVVAQPVPDPVHGPVGVVGSAARHRAVGRLCRRVGRVGGGFRRWRGVGGRGRLGEGGG